MAKLLIVDDDLSLRQFLTIFLRKEGHDIEVASNGLRALETLKETRFDVVLTDLRMPRMGGLDLLSEIAERGISTQVIVMTAYSTTETALEAMRRGAYDYIVKPFQLDAVRVVIEKCLEKGSLIAENKQLKQELAKGGKRQVELIYHSEAMANVDGMIARVAPTPSSVLLLGESGTGKEVVARLLHRRSERQGRPFVAINCGAIPDQLMESELFGHVKGSFTGATKDKKGLFEAANGGTLFLDEIGELSFSLQVKLLRVLQERTITPVGSTAEVPIDVRVVAATHKEMRAAVRDGEFRADLYYRLNVIEIRLPPLRERREDVLPLAAHFLERLNRRMGRDLRGFDESARRVLRQLSYFGNVRELENIVERAVALETATQITATYLPDPGSSSVFHAAPVTEQTLPTDTTRTAEELVAQFVEGVDRLLQQPDRDLELEHILTVLERDVLRCTLEHTHQNKTDAAARLGMSFRQFRYKIAKLANA
ncbi:MAG: sigma-54-dependent Fis family transcriptional regulator [Myxococcales bacterium]|nr:sigma-54-dependent Fis family transcriptional regulator [Myxococcales bacterium]